MTLALAIVLLVLGTVIFHFASPWYLTPLASNWGTIDDTITITFWVTGIVFIAVNLFMAYAIIKYRYDKNRRAEYQPENKKLETWLTGITAVGVAAMLTPGLFVWGEFVTPPDDAWELEAVGAQWNWSYRLAGEDGEFGAVESRFVTDDNLFGMDDRDPAGQDDILVESPMVHIPINQPLKVNLRSKDVLHDFAVAQFRVKMDLVPGLVSYLWFTPTKLGRYEVLCEELCGIGHHTMRGWVVVDEQEDFDAWVAEQPTWAEMKALQPGDAARGQVAYVVCGTCHGPNGEGMQTMNGPKIAGQEAWYLRRQLNYFKNGTRGAHPEDTFGQQMAPMAQTLVNDQTREDVIAYIQTLPDVPPDHTVTGDAGRGARSYVVCGACHGQQGQGIRAVNAPRQAGMSDWYLVTQLNNFKNGVRGRHHLDMFGAQMGDMADILKSDQAVNDVVAYINTLPPVSIAQSSSEPPSTPTSLARNEAATTGGEE
jgi:cytochrome c oxidase subunit 2